MGLEKSQDAENCTVAGRRFLLGYEQLADVKRVQRPDQGVTSGGVFMEAFQPS